MDQYDDQQSEKKAKDRDTEGSVSKSTEQNKPIKQALKTLDEAPQKAVILPAATPGTKPVPKATVATQPTIITNTVPRPATEPMIMTNAPRPPAEPAVKKQGGDQYEPINFEAELPPPEAKTQRISANDKAAEVTQQKPDQKQSIDRSKPWTLGNFWKGLAPGKAKQNSKEQKLSKTSGKSAEQIQEKDDDTDLQSRTRLKPTATSNDKKESNSYKEMDVQFGAISKLTNPSLILRSVTDDRHRDFTKALMEEWRILQKSNWVSVIILASIWILILSFLLVFDIVMMSTSSYDELNW